MKILGIDPGIETTGYGLIEDGRCLTYGCITTPRGKSAGERLCMLEEELSRLLKEHHPKVVAVERLFFFKNLKTAMPVSEARGVILLAIAKRKLPIHEFSPLQVKMTVAGYGRADKKQIQRMVKESLGLQSLPKPDDAADALGIALTCSYSLKIGLGA